MAAHIEDVIGGAAGGIAIISVHEAARRLRDDAPRSDILGKRAIVATMKAAGRRPPRDPMLYRVSIASGLLSDAAIYSLVGRSFHRALAVGALVGLGTVLLPRPLGLGTEPSARRPTTAIMTLTWYTIGALAAWAAASAAGALLDSDDEAVDAGHHHHPGHPEHEGSGHDHGEHGLTQLSPD